MLIETQRARKNSTLIPHTRRDEEMKTDDTLSMTVYAYAERQSRSRRTEPPRPEV